MKKLNDLHNNNKGSALVVSLVVMAVLMMLCLALILVSSTLHQSVQDNNAAVQCRELAKSVSVEIQKELESVDFTTFDEQCESLQNGENELWFYLRYNIWQNNWPYYNDEETGHTDSFAYRYFKFKTADDAYIADEISVCVFWESYFQADEGNKEDTPLDIVVTVKKGDKEYSIKSVYTLQVTDYLNEFGMPLNSELTHTYTDTSVNPKNNKIIQVEKWNWYLTERE